MFSQDAIYRIAQIFCFLLYKQPCRKAAGLLLELIEYLQLVEIGKPQHLYGVGLAGHKLMKRDLCNGSY